MFFPLLLTLLHHSVNQKVFVMRKFQHNFLFQRIAFIVLSDTMERNMQKDEDGGGGVGVGAKGRR